ncbi:hypothetical protein [Hazenella coriacea]|uniref:Uncharacterized protein n=1 Tax=Hazenella coriacea TaxID=1179467 RepID=A0A4R3LE65_9BACL|nr:hypothetical protein [Hazenella coriacea]TCS95736.1 hypothetical protein EDD58_102316 [Hazenella coriacea]
MTTSVLFSGCSEIGISEEEKRAKEQLEEINKEIDEGKVKVDKEMLKRMLKEGGMTDEELEKVVIPDNGIANIDQFIAEFRATQSEKSK